jgi:hypothetical protein
MLELAMTREQLEHIIRAASVIAQDDEIIVVGSQAILGQCLEPHDLVLSKYVPFREKDQHFITEAIAHGLVDRSVLEARLPTMAIRAEQRDAIAARIARAFATGHAG